MPGTRDIGIGALIFLVGGLVTLISRNSGGGGVIAYGAILVGLAIMVKGILTNRQHKKRAPEEAEAERAGQVANGAIRMTVAMAAADGELAGGERYIVRGVARDVYGYAIDDETMDQIFVHFVSDKSAMAKEAAALATVLGPEEAQEVLKYTAMVAYADGELSETESGALGQLAQALKLSDQDRSIQMQSAFGEIQRIVREQQQAREAQPGG